MTVKYQTSTETTMDIDDGNLGNKHLFMDGSKFQNFVHALRNSPVRVAALALGFLCVVLVAGLIGQSVHCRKVGNENQNKFEAVTGEMDNLQSNLKTAQNEKKNLEITHDHLQQNYNNTSNSKYQMNNTNSQISEEVIKLKQSESTLQASNTALSKELEELKASKEKCQTNNEALSTAKDSLQTKYDSIARSKNDLQANFDTVTKERDNLQNQFNNATRSKEKLQNDYNSLIKDIEHLEERYRASSSERDSIASSHQNLTMEKENLQATYTTLSKATDKLLASYNSVIEEKKYLESCLKNVTAERDLQSVEISSMSSVVDHLRATVTRLNTTTKVCPSNWKKFDTSCYFASKTKDTWYSSRDFCKNKKAHLVIINSHEEMKFVNNLFSSPGIEKIWIGLTDQGVEGHWVWMDGTPLSLQFWAVGQPNRYSDNQDCGEFWYRSSGNAEWNDANCSSYRYWVCEM
ncbi:C-type lectin domain family 4 member M-like isoform X2 [Corythoichthys intestinalis]|uniref:C-type lectin domain family 4 member M-like isoform X2 n=1 Tax=Corythoichthys intestinalis TaxID=161448 RepID=UPI0025A4F8D3|nr:C-type lectin domain family 4 member M-like isoform X2 [Corythoichthys intestinalis]XP_061792468.1 C-type lectin domain family 4 member M-like [Nerophis lumbriciformis]